MFQRETRVENHKCPECGAKLVNERDMLLCKEHGAFFAYGPQLLVRVARPAAKGADSLLPWESPRASLA